MRFLNKPKTLVLSSVPIKIFYAKGIRVSLQNRSFNQAMQLIWVAEPFCNYDPLKMVFTATGKILFMDKNAFYAYLSGNLTQQELIELTECDELYRNKIDLEIVETGCLWKLTDKTLTLIDEDNFVQTDLDLEVFEVAE